MTATGSAPVTATLRYASASASLAPVVRVEAGVPAVAVDGERDAEAGLLVDPDHAGVLRLGQHGVAEHVAVVLLGDPGLVAQVRRRDHPQQGLAQRLRRRRPGQRLGPVGLQQDQVGRLAHRPGVDRTVVGERARRHVDHDVVVPGDQQPARLAVGLGRGDLADRGGQHAPLLGDLEHRVELAPARRSAASAPATRWPGSRAAPSTARAAAPAPARPACRCRPRRRSR